MVVCVTKNSYNIIFVTAFAAIIAFTAVTAFFYEKMIKASQKRLSNKESNYGKIVAVCGLTMGVLLVIILTVSYFLFQEKI
jgi:hypothetical protein